MSNERIAEAVTLLWILASGCAAHRVGLLETGEPPPVLQSIEGREEKLLLLGEAARLRALDGYLVEIHGTKGLGRIKVSHWRALEGPHGLPVWVGPVQVLGIQVGIQDTGSGMLVFVDNATAREMERYAGDWVAAEGYIDGPQRVKVLHWLALEESAEASESR